MMGYCKENALLSLQYQLYMSDDIVKKHEVTLLWKSIYGKCPKISNILFHTILA